ncbi:MAG: hypothetical protein EXR69_10080 [Myxococcales bacterium]|nr:hypothetical protein [Myxococcales bacterium]
MIRLVLTTPVLGLLSVLGVLAGPAHASTLKPTWSSSSSAPIADGVSYDAVNLGDGKGASAWFEGAEGSGLNEWVQADLGGDKAVAGFTIWSGWWYTASQWTHYSRPKTLQVEFSDGTTQEFTLQDSYAPQSFDLSSAKKSSTMKFKIKSAFTSDAYADTAISEIQVRDTAKSSAAAVRSMSASTTFPADGDGNYEAKNVHDGMLDTVWCEGNPTGDGTGDWLEFSFASNQSIASLDLRNGNAYNFGVFMKSNRTTAATLTFGDGSTTAIVVKDTLTSQKIAFPAHTTDRVRLSFDTVKRGSEYNDLCVAEASFSP